MAELRVSVIQMRVRPCDPEANLEHASDLIEQAAKAGAELVCLPEMWTTGFNWEWIDKNLAHQARVRIQVAELARAHKVWLNGSILVANNSGRAANTSIMFRPDGTEAAVYRKVHLFGIFAEEKHLAPGEGLSISDCPWGKTALAICYDIRFPELFRSYALNGAVMQLCPAAFPHPRLEHWQVLLRARAIENQLFMIAANQVGEEPLVTGGTVRYFGHSAIIDPWGTVLAEGGEDEEILTTTIDMSQVALVRRRIPVFSDRRPDVYKCSD